MDQFQMTFYLTCENNFDDKFGSDSLFGSGGSVLLGGLGWWWCWCCWCWETSIIRLARFCWRSDHVTFVDGAIQHLAIPCRFIVHVILAVWLMIAYQLARLFIGDVIQVVQNVALKHAVLVLVLLRKDDEEGRVFKNVASESLG